MISKTFINGIEIITVETKQLSFSVAPALGGKITSVFNKHLQKEFLWTNQNLPLKMNEQGADYDTNFYGAIDELLPSDVAETVDGLSYPDHGELWTTPLQYEEAGEKITVSGTLAISGLHYSKTIYADDNSPVIYTSYSITNKTASTRSFLWKLHAALQVQEGDKIISSARFGQVVDPAYSRFTTTDPFAWPIIENMDASIIPENDNTVDFFYLYDTQIGDMQLLSADEQHLFSYRYDTKVFPYEWMFASYGAFLDHYVAILEPCTNMPMSIQEAKAKGQCAILQPGETLTTTVRIYAGEKSGYIP